MSRFSDSTGANGLSNIDYQASGRLIAAIGCTTEDPIYLIIVERATEYVVSFYRRGETSWWQGHYFKSLSEALACFDLMIRKHS